MSGLVLWLAVLVVLAAVLTIALRREYARLERQRRLAALMADFTREWAATKQAIGERLLPVMTQMVEAILTMRPAMERLGEVLRTAKPLTTTDIAAAEKRIRDAGRP